MGDKARLEALSRMIAEELGKAAKKPELHIVGARRVEPEVFDRAVARDLRLGLIGRLRAMRKGLRHMQVELFYQEALDGRSDLSELSDDELVQLRETLDRAIENYHTPDSGSYYEAGLLRSHGG